MPFRLGVDQYEEIIRKGIFTKRDRVELIEGQLVAKMTKGTRHSAGVTKSWKVIDRATPPGWHVRVEAPVRIPSQSSMPEPDISVARGEIDDYLDRNPDPVDIALVVEVSDTSLDEDRTMASIYGGGGIPAYWIVNVADRQLEVYSNPVGGAYPAPTILGETESVELILDGQVVARIAVADLLPKRA
jgi:Uma2 family endonuclease